MPTTSRTGSQATVRRARCGESETVPDADLSPETLLQLAPGVRTRFDAAGHVLLDAPDGTIVDLGPRGYATLSLFVRPLALGEAIDRLEREAPATDFAPTMHVLNMLIEEGALVRPGAGRGPASGWADPVEHARMLHDDRRTGDYLAALAAAVRPGDVVLDIGTGSGVLAVAAARAGARRVYAVEASDIAEVAGRVFAANGVTDTVTLVPGWSRQIELPEPADLLVAEIIGNEPLEEEILETTLDARRRLLKPDARLDPAPADPPGPAAPPPGRRGQAARDRAGGRRALAGPVRAWSSSRCSTPPLPGPVNMPTEAEVVAAWPPVGPPAVLARGGPGDVRGRLRARLGRPRRRRAGHGERRRRHVPRRPPRARSSTRSIPGRGRPRAGRPPCGCSPSRSRSERGPRCGCGTRAERGTRRTGSPARSSRWDEVVRCASVIRSGD